MATRIGEHTGARHVAAFRTSGVAFFLAAQPEADAHYRRRAQAVAEMWRDVIEVRWVELGG